MNINFYDKVIDTTSEKIIATLEVVIPIIIASMLCFIVLGLLLVIGYDKETGTSYGMEDAVVEQVLWIAPIVLGITVDLLRRLLSKIIRGYKVYRIKTRDFLWILFATKIVFKSHDLKDGNFATSTNKWITEHSSMARTYDYIEDGVHYYAIFFLKSSDAIQFKLSWDGETT